MITRKDLVDISDADYGTRRDEFMQCQDCGHMFGGTRGDFFLMPMDEVFACPGCRSENIAIVQRVSKIEVVKQ